MNQLLAEPGFKAKWVKGESSELYHADKTSVGSTQLRKVLKSPKTFLNYFENGSGEEPSSSMKFGTLAHHALLEREDFERRLIVMPDFGDFRSSKNREARDEWKAAQDPKAVICSQEERDNLVGVVDAILSNKDAHNIISGAQCEVSGYYVDQETGIKCRIRPDIWNKRVSANFDVKTATDASLEQFARTVWNMRYDFQVPGMYSEGIEQIEGQKVEFDGFIVVEPRKPYEVAVYVSDDIMKEIGKRDYRRALRTLRESIDKQTFAGYQAGMQNISLPTWAVQNFGAL